MMKQIAVIIMFFVIGCGPGRIDSFKAPVTKHVQNKDKKSNKLAVFKSSGNTAFDIVRPFFIQFMQKGESLKNPFKSNLAMFAPKVSVVVDKAIEQKKEAPKTPLEYYDISAYKLTAVISGIALPKAMVIDRKGTAYLIKLGTPIGNKGGRVTAITASGVVVEEPGSPPITMQLVKSTNEMTKVIESMYEY